VFRLGDRRGAPLGLWQHSGFSMIGHGLTVRHPDREDLVLKKWLAVGMVIAVVVMWGKGPVSAGEVVITGMVTNWYQVKNKVSDKAYFQVVKKQEKLTSKTDKEGLAALDSNLPKIPVRSSGGFRANLSKVPPGEYFIALQRGLSSTPILVKDGNPLIFKIPGDFPLNLGNVTLEMPLGYAPPKAHMEVVK
jgi:hypothetical protein